MVPGAAPGPMRSSGFSISVYANAANQHPFARHATKTPLDITDSQRTIELLDLVPDRAGAWG
jgi:hypothetical protein